MTHTSMVAYFWIPPNCPWWKRLNLSRRIVDYSRLANIFARSRAWQPDSQVSSACQVWQWPRSPLWIRPARPRRRARSYKWKRSSIDRENLISEDASRSGSSGRRLIFIRLTWCPSPLHLISASWTQPTIIPLFRRYHIWPPQWAPVCLAIKARTSMFWLEWHDQVLLLEYPWDTLLPSFLHAFVWF